MLRKVAFLANYDSCPTKRKAYHMQVLPNKSKCGHILSRASKDVLFVRKRNVLLQIFIFCLIMLKHKEILKILEHGRKHGHLNLCHMLKMGEEGIIRQMT